MRRPRVSPRHLLTYSHFPTGGPSTRTVGDKLIDVLIDTGSTCTGLNKKLTKRSLAAVSVTEVSRQ